MLKLVKEMLPTKKEASHYFQHLFSVIIFSLQRIIRRKVDLKKKNRKTHFIF